jgi:hypothetical protein
MSSGFEYRIITPANGPLRDESRMIVMAPGFRDSMYTYLPRKSQATADATGLRVLYYDSPATGTAIITAAESRAISNDPVASAARTGKHIARALAAEGASSAIMAGNSRGATEAVTIAATETVPVGAISVMETVGLVDVTRLDGVWRYASYQIRDVLHAALAKQLGLITYGEPVDKSSLPPMVDQLTEMRTHIGLACSDIPLRSMVHVAAMMPEVAVNAVAAGHTFTAPAGYHHLLAATLPLLRGENEAPFAYTIEPDAWHSSYEDLPRFAGHVAATVAMAEQFAASQSE